MAASAVTRAGGGVAGGAVLGRGRGVALVVLEFAASRSAKRSWYQLDSNFVVVSCVVVVVAGDGDDAAAAVASVFRLGCKFSPLSPAAPPSDHDQAGATVVLGVVVGLVTRPTGLPITNPSMLIVDLLVVDVDMRVVVAVAP